jgi:WXG100 family type VII secretion target
MSAIDEARAVPGGGALADLAVKLVGDPDAVTAAANSWRTAAGSAQLHSGALRTATADVGDGWQGAGADAFAAYMNKVVRCGDDLQQVLRECGGHLDSAAEKLRAAESQALEICQSYASAAQELRKASPPPTDDQVLEGMRRTRTEALEILAKLVTETGSALDGAAGKIRDALGRIPDVEAVLTEPDDQPFAPAAGKPLGWTPAAAEGSTALAGAPPRAAADTGFGGYGSSGPPPASGGGSALPKQVEQWVEEAMAILAARGYPTGQMRKGDILAIIQHESGGNPHAINNWDSNAAKGTPSKGLMQTIDPTFDRWKLPGHEDIYNPVDNIIAGVRYAIGRYGSTSNVPGIVGLGDGTGYRGY